MDHIITIGGEKHEIRFTTEALEYFEELTGKPSSHLFGPDSGVIPDNTEDYIKATNEVTQRFYLRKNIKQLIKVGLYYKKEKAPEITDEQWTEMTNTFTKTQILGTIMLSAYSKAHGFTNEPEEEGAEATDEKKNQ